MTTLTVEIPDELNRALDDIARCSLLSREELAVAALRGYVLHEQFKAIRRVTKPLAEAQGYRRDDDVFDQVS